MTEQQLAAERAAFEKLAEEYFAGETEDDNTNALVLEGDWRQQTTDGNYSSWRLSEAFFFWQAALAQREPVADAVISAWLMRLRETALGLTPSGMREVADLLERTEAARVAAVSDVQTWRQAAYDRNVELTAERERGEKLVEAIKKALDEATGIYPKSITQNGVTTERTDWQSGWNKAVMEMGEALDRIDALVDDYQSSKENGHD